MSPSETAAIPKGWLAAGSNPKSYDMILCEDKKHSGSRCAVIRSTKKKINGFGTLMQSFHPQSYKQQRIKLTAYIKSEDVNDWAGLWMRVDEGREIASFDNMQDRPIAGNTDWTKYEIVLDVPLEATNISFGVLLQGTGTVWMDDFHVEKVSSETMTTASYSRSCGIQYQNGEPINLDFSEGLRPENRDLSISGTPVGWFEQVNSDGARGEVTIGLEEYSSGVNGHEVFIKCSDTAHGALLQAIIADQYVGTRVRLSADIKTESVVGAAGLFFRADVGRTLSVCYDHMDKRKLSGTTGWRNYNCVIDIPEGSDNIYIGGTLNGGGTVWFKNFKFEKVDQDVATTGKHGEYKSKKKKTPPKKLVNSSPENLSFTDDEVCTTSNAKYNLPKGWISGGDNPQKYRMIVDETTMFDASCKCALIETLQGGENGFGTLMQQVDAKPYHQKRMRLNAHIKTEAAGWAALWMRIDGAEGEILGFDNMQHNPITDSTDWNYYETVLEVPETSEVIAFGILLSGGGKVWFTKVGLEEASGDVEVTDIKEILYEPQPVNLNFEDN